MTAKSSKAYLVATLLRELANIIEALKETDFEAIIFGKAQLDIKIVTKVKGLQPSNQQITFDEKLKAAVEKLSAMQTREEGESFLMEHFTTKDELIRLAKMIDIQIQKKDTISQIIERIIEATIGFRTRSAAIQASNS